MKIEIVTDTYAPDANGTAVSLGFLVKGLIAKGHDVQVVKAGKSEDHEGVIGVKSVKVPIGSGVRWGMASKKWFRQRWQENAPDIIFVATEGLMGYRASKVAHDLNIPVARGFFANKHYYSSLYALSSVGGLMKKYMKQSHEDAYMTIVPTEACRQQLQDLGVLNVHVLGRGVDSTVFSPHHRDMALRKEWGAWQEELVFGIVGRLSVEKNHTAIMRLVQKLQQEKPQQSIKLVVVGDGELKDELKTQFPDAIFMGQQSGDALSRCFASMDVLLHGGESQCFGNVVWEGMASGLPVITYRSVASADIIEHGYDGLLADSGDESGFYSLMHCLSADASLRKEMGLAARKKVLSHSWESIVERFEELLNQALPTDIFHSDNEAEKLWKVACNEYRTVFLSDIHLGTTDAKADECRRFLSRLKIQKLVLVGDIIDGWALARHGKWKKSHSRLIRTILKKMEKEDMEVVYLRGNHDDILDRLLPFGVGKLSIKKEAVHVSMDGKKYLCVHGDGFDAISTNYKFLAILGSLGYDVLLAFNRLYNRYRAWRGLEYYSVSKLIKSKVKSAVSYVGKYETQLQQLAKLRGCDGIIAGHVHHQADVMVEDVHYLNCGDWVETMSAVVEHWDGRFEVVMYQDFMACQDS